MCLNYDDYTVGRTISIIEVVLNIKLSPSHTLNIVTQINNKFSQPSVYSGYECLCSDINTGKDCGLLMFCAITPNLCFNDARTVVLNGMLDLEFR